MSYSVDLRERVITFIETGGSKVDAARIFGVARVTIYSWLTKKTQTGTVKDAPPKRGWKKINPQALITYVNEHPDLTLADYAKHFGASAPSIFMAFKRSKITRKKRPRFTRNEANKNVPYFWSK